MYKYFVKIFLSFIIGVTQTLWASQRKTNTMRNIKLILIGLILTNNLSAQTSKRVIKLKGTISDKYPIIMTLTFQGENILGYYYYEKYKTKILLEGQITGNKITLKESPYRSELKMGFIGDLTDSSFTGVWTDTIKNKSLEFKSSIHSDNYIKVAKNISEIEGTYESIYNSEKYLGSVELKYIEDELFCFEINIGSELCVGYLKGLVTLTDLHNGIYSGDHCEELTFLLSTKGLTLTEKNCDLHHGMRCSFEGKYIKKE